MCQVKRTGVVFLPVILALQAITDSAAAAMFYIDDDGPGNYTTIQSALKGAVSGDTIVVSPGTYSDKVIVDKV